MTIEWANVALGKVAEIQTGKLDSNQAIENGDYPFFTCAPEPLRINDYAFDCDAILLAGNNANGVFHLNRYAGKFNAYQRTYVITPKHAGQLNIKFLYYALHTLVRRLGEYSQGTATKFLTMRILSPLPVPLPSIGEQNAIACILGALDDKIELNRRMNRTLEAMARALFQSWFVDFDAVRAKLALNGAEGAAGLKPAIAALFPDRLVAVDGREMPEGWKLTTLGDVTAKHGGLIQTGPFGSQLHASDYVEAGIPTIMPKDISDRRVRTEKIAYIDEADAARLGRHRVAPGDIVYSRRGDVERHALIGKREQGWLCGTGCMLVRPGARWPSPLFMSLHLDRPDIKEWITQHAIGATMPNLNTSVLGQVPILAPSHTILKAFEVLAGPLDEKSADNDRQSRTLAALRDTLLPKLISGALRVADAERIVGRCVS